MFGIFEGRNNREVEIQLKNLDNITTRGIRQGFYQVGVIARRTINENVLKRPRSGRVYKTRGRRHRASVEGESFANRTGAARRTLGFDVRGAQELEFGFRANDKTLYTKILEEKRNRPTVKIGSDSTVSKAVVIMEDEIKKAHKEGYK